MTDKKNAILAMARVIVKHSELTRSAFTADEWYEIEEMNGNWKERAAALVYDRDLIGAIKLIRTYTGASLAEAKTMAESWT